MTFRQTLVLLAVCCALFAGSVRFVRAADTTALLQPCDTIFDNSDPKNPHYDDPCSVETFFEQFNRLAQYAYNVASLLGTGLLIVGGIYYLLAGGRKEMISQGTKIITGTITGLIIVFTAYVIINYTMSALAGTKPRSNNPVAFLFPHNSNVSRFFDTTPGSTTTASDCKAGPWTWDICSTQIFCADDKDTGGTIFSTKEKLNRAGCVCGDADACFGSSMVSCVERFQLANSLPPSGTITSATKTKIDDLFKSNGGSNTCTTRQSEISTIMSTKVPAAVMSASGSSSKTGCCVVGGTRSPVYCLEDISQRSCYAAGGTPDGFFEGTKNCDGNEAKVYCGYCKGATPTGVSQCFQFVSPSWCSGTQSYTSGSCNSTTSGCSGDKCTTSLFLKTPGT